MGHEGDILQGAGSTKESIGSITMAVVATKDVYGSFLVAFKEAKGATRDSGGVTSIEPMSGGLDTIGCDHTDGVLTQELDLNTSLGRRDTEDGALANEGGADEDCYNDIDELHDEEGGMID